MSKTGRIRKKKRIHIIITIMIVAVIAGIAAAGYMIYLKPVEIDLMTVMATPQFTGVDGEGSLETIMVDQKKADRMTSSVKGKKRAESVKIFLKDVAYQTDQEDHLTTGDRIFITAVYDKAFAKNNKIKVTRSTKTITAKGFNARPNDISVKAIENSQVLEHLTVSLNSNRKTFDYMEQELYCKSSGGNMIAAIVSVGDSYKIYNTSKFTYKLDGVEWETLDAFRNKKFSSMSSARNAIKEQGYTYEEIAMVY